MPTPFQLSQAREIRRVWRTLTTLPSLRGWTETLFVTLAFAALALPIGVQGQLLSVAPAPEHWGWLVMRVLFVPSLVEELVFRALPPPRFWWLSLVAYVLSHPFNAWLFMPEARGVFYDPVFLVLAALLGACCTLTVRRTGSLWSAVALHWLAASSWLAFMGGEAALR